KEREEREKKEREEREKKEREEKEREEREKKEREEREKKEREKKEREKKEREKKEREKKEREAATNEERERTIVTSGGSEGQERQKPAGLLAELLEISGNRCGHCGERFVESDPPEISHFLPHSLKGEASIENCLPSHHLCNSAHDTVNQLLDIDNAHYWVRGAYTGKPLRQSINMLDPDNIYANWKRAMEHLQIPKRVDQREHLIKHGFTKLPLPL
ncbi:MAG: hypothetical protein EBS86_16015, partial [Crocinitomicaceae bacterium]|nr:hypothetical protein [Crocinitomicaceae bacterium]